MITIHITARELEAVVEVTDDGPGFNPIVVETKRTGMGLFIMRERMALVGGQLEILDIGKQGTHMLSMNVLDTYVRRPHTHGTRVRATVPLSASLYPAPRHTPLPSSQVRQTGDVVA
jgi:glucose-6-phosphate-specific signal transduction histidine kinase